MKRDFSLTLEMTAKAVLREGSEKSYFSFFSGGIIKEMAQQRPVLALR
jgi:hypothetical protein